ncbi:MAG: SDR family oxidoreductase [Novosphingobium sp.]|nr:SDR family oxidoreductase [Novosphingobium sp.]MCP5402923.1 SDR family oxidoreductase [Novosphingobium sp.]
MSSTDMLGLTGKVAIVWGGGFGMGERTSLRLAEAGAHVAVVDLVPERAEKIAGEIVAGGGKAVALSADVTDEPSVEAALAEAEAALGPVDVMATVIGLGVWGQLVDFTMEEWEEAHRINLTSFFIPARAVARSLMKNGKPGAIACVSSVSGLTSAPTHGGYGAAKAGMINLVRTMAAEWGPYGIRVNAAMPGSCETPRLEFGPEAKAKMQALLPLGRAATPDEIAKGLLFLLSDLASYVTGHNLRVDGGWTSTFLMHSAGSQSMTRAESA